MTTTAAMREALQHIAAGHDAVCFVCGWIGCLSDMDDAYPFDDKHDRGNGKCPNCGNLNIIFGEDRIAAYALRQAGGGRRGVSAKNEDQLVRECNQLSDSINEGLIKLQNDAFERGHQRGRESAINAAPDLLAALKSLEWSIVIAGNKACPRCKALMAGRKHAPDCLIGNAIARAEGGEG